MYSFSHFELDRIDGKWYSLDELNKALSQFEGQYDFANERPTIKVFFKNLDTGSVELIAQAQADTLGPIIKSLEEAYELTVPAVKMSVDTKSVIDSLIDQEEVVLSPINARFISTKSNRVFGSVIVQELLIHGYLVQVRSNKYIVNKSSVRK